MPNFNTMFVCLNYEFPLHALLYNRGYGESSKPPHTSDYTMNKLTQDILELVSHCEINLTYAVSSDLYIVNDQLFVDTDSCAWL